MENKDKHKEMGAIFKRLFSSHEGEYVLERMKEHTVDKPNGNWALDGMGIAMSMAHEEGQNAMYRWILNTIKRGGLGQ